MDLAEGSTQASEPSFPIPSATRTRVSHGDDRPEWQEDSQQIPSMYHITSTEKLNWSQVQCQDRQELNN